MNPDLEILHEEREQLQREAQELRAKYSGLNLLDVDEQEKIEEREESWSEWEERFHKNFDAIKAIEEENL